MDMLMGDKIVEANLADWRKLAQGLHTRYVVDDFGAAARFVAAVGEAGDALGHHPIASIGKGYVDLKLISDDAIYREDDGTEHVIEWVTQQDVDLARRITEIAADHKIDADPASVSMIELGLDTAHSATIAPVWAALLTGNAEAQGHGSPAAGSGTPWDGCRTCRSGTPTSANPASAVPRRGLRGARGGRAADRHRRRRGWGRRRRQRRAGAHRHRRPGRQQGVLCVDTSAARND